MSKKTEALKMKVTVKNYYYNVQNNVKTVDVIIDVKNDDLTQIDGYFFLNDKDYKNNIYIAKDILRSKNMTYKNFFTYTIEKTEV
jgi:hypothetical protein